MIDLHRDSRMEFISGEIIRLADLALRTAIKDFTPDQLIEMRNGNIQLHQDFTRKLFASWKVVQNEVLALQLTFWDQFPDFQDDPILKYAYRYSQRILDCIMWHHYGPDITDMKRLYNFDAQIFNLSHHNIESHIEIANKINNDPNQFALITDLTSGVRLGDIFAINIQREKHFIEVKAGSINSEILNAKNEQDSTKIKEIQQDKKKSKQLQRIENQETRAKNAMKAIQNEDSVDDRFKVTPNLKVILTPKPFEDFSEDLRPFLDNFLSSNNPLATLEVESCLLIIAYRPVKPLKMVRNSFISNFEKDSDLKGVLLEWSKHLLHSTIMRPIFMQPINPDCIHAIVKGEIIVEFYFSLSKFRDEFNSNKIGIDFKSNKQFRRDYHQFKQQGGPSPLYESNKGSLYFTFKEHNPSKSYMFSEGLFTRLISNLVKPSHLVYLHQVLYQQLTTSSA